MLALDEDRTAIVMGLGRFGGGLGATRYLLNQGMRVIVTDQASESELANQINALSGERNRDRLQFMLGGHDEVPMETSDLLVVNPAVPTPWNNVHIKRAYDSGLTVCTEMELLFERLRTLKQHRVVTVTGSAGKSTTCSMIAHLARRSGMKCLLGGNIGGSLLNHEDEELAEADVVVLELSSFMLHWLRQGLVTFEPEVGILTGLDENHIDWHESLEHYIDSKSVIRKCRLYVPPFGADSVSSSIDELHGTSCESGWWHPPEDDWTVSLRNTLLDRVRTSLPGAHQRENAVTACVALAALVSDPKDRMEFASSLTTLIDDFDGLEHRLRPLGTSSGILVVDDSKSTTPAATQKAVEAFDDPGRIHLIAGGYDKGSDLSQITSLSNSLGGLYCVGQTGPRISGGANAIQCHTISNAVEEASRHLEEGDVLLLSPGCASWDQFNDYQERGIAFKKAVESALGSLKK